MADTVHDDLTSGGDFGGQPIGDPLKIRQISSADDDECRDRTSFNRSAAGGSRPRAGASFSQFHPELSPTICVSCARHSTRSRAGEQTVQSGATSRFRPSHRHAVRALRLRRASAQIARSSRTIERGVDQGQARRSIGIEQRVVKSDSATHRQADQTCSGCVQVVEQRSKIVGISKLCARGHADLPKPRTS